MGLWWAAAAVEGEWVSRKWAGGGKRGAERGEGGTGSTTAPHKAPLQRQRAGRDSQGRLASQPLHQMIFLAINHSWPPQTHIYRKRQ